MIDLIGDPVQLVLEMLRVLSRRLRPNRRVLRLLRFSGRLALRRIRAGSPARILCRTRIRIISNSGTSTRSTPYSGTGSSMISMSGMKRS